MSIVFQKRIDLFLKKAGRKGMRHAELMTACKLKKGEKPLFNEALDLMLWEGKAVNRGGKFYASSALGFVPGVVTGLQRTFGFVCPDGEQETDVFVPGFKMQGAIEGDKVLLKITNLPDGRREGSIERILEESERVLSGILTRTDHQFYFCPDGMDSYNWKVTKTAEKLVVGQKALAILSSRSDNHRYHQVEVIKVLGSAEDADVCAEGILAAAGIAKDFSNQTIDEAKYAEHKGIAEKDLFSRTDLRDMTIFTIDGADTKDIDDAVSIEKTADGYRLGVHIADVSHYVRPGSSLDREAYERGTSIYYADQVVPMLPKELSNGICSLNEGEDRLAFSAFLTISPSGERTGFELKKTVIRSRKKGVYSEVNAIFDGTASPEVQEKYAAFSHELQLMRKLKDILSKRRRGKGAPDLSSVESKFIFDEERNVVEILPRQSGEAEGMIEEFMIAANEGVAAFAKEQELPFVYRIHERPDRNKLDELHTVLELLSVPCEELSGNVSAKNLSDLLEKSREHPAFFLINRQILRSMSKARYSEKPVGHYGMSLDDYCHFTSPIRRYPDLMIHRILTELALGYPSGSAVKRYRTLAEAAAKQSSETELNALWAERSCEDSYKAQHMSRHLGEEYDGIISSVTSYGFFVLLPNTVEGLVHIEELPEGSYLYDGYFSLTEELTGKTYRCGESVKVRCAAADISGGKVDLVLAE